MSKITEEQVNDLVLMMEQLAGDIRELTYAISDFSEVVERDNDPAGIGEIRERIMKLRVIAYWVKYLTC